MTTELPRMLRITQKFPATPPVDLATMVQSELAAIADRLKPGMRVGIAVGSRGITGLQAIVAAIVQVLRAADTQPFILPAMGSHGGATPEGQTALLAEYGVTEENLHVPIRAAMDVKRVGITPEGLDVYCSLEALSADAIVIVNRIKPHTDFSGTLGSGIMKMIVVGLGKRVGAAQYHVASSRSGYEETLRAMARVLLQNAPILGGLAILENQRHETAAIVLLKPEEIEAREELLFAEAKRLMPKLPFDDIDLLIVDRIGKNLSGSGMDPNVVGRSIHGYSAFLNQPNLPPPRIKRICVRELSPETHGNAIGIGFADLTTTRLVKAMDRRVTYLNALTALTPNGAKIPIHFDTDQETLAAALRSLGLEDIGQARVVRIADTLSLGEMEVSEACLPALSARTDLEVVSEPKDMEFDADGNLPAMRLS